MKLSRSGFVQTAFVLGLFSQFKIHAEESVIKVDGSSTVFPITEGIAEEFQKANQGSKVTVGISGTGGGFKKFCRNETDLQDASRPITKEEMATCREAKVKYIEIPIAFDAITLVVNPKNTWVNDISFAELKKIWEPEAHQKIKMWKMVRGAWPINELKLFGAGSDSGTFDYFTEAVVGKAKASRGDYTASEDDNTLVQGVSTDVGALGYIPYSYYAANTSKLKALAVSRAPGVSAVLPSEKTIRDATYPLSRPLFLYVNVKSLDRKEVKALAEFYLKNAATISAQVSYVPLPPKAYTMGLEHLAKKKLGTAFGGESHVGIKVEEILKREANL